MNRVIKLFFSFLLALLVIFSSAGFTIGKMVCLNSGHTILKLENVYDCCEKPDNPTPVITSECCSISNVSLALENYAPSKEEHLPFISITNVLLAGLTDIKTPLYTTANCIKSVVYPPASLRPGQLLHFISLLLI